MSTSRHFGRATAGLLFVGLVGVATLALPSRALADDVADEADLQFELGAARYQQADYLGALEHFLASNRLAFNRNVVFNIARCYEQLKRFPDAFRAYTQALEGESNPQTKSSIQEALARISPKVAVLDVRTDPAGATIYLDRKDLGARGATPRLLGLAPGKYKILVELPGYEPAASKEVTIVAGTTTTIDLKLDPILATVTIDGDGKGANVRVDAESAKIACVVPCSVSLPPGHHTIFLDRQGYQPTELPIDVLPKQKLELRPKLSVLSGDVVVNADLRDALIEVDGKPFGFTPAVLQIPVGPHRLRVSLSGYKTVERDVEVVSTTQTKVDVQLSEATEVTAASRTTESIEEAPASVSIIPKSELVGMGYPTIAEALRGVRGVYITDDRSYLALGFRGFSRPGDYGNRVLTLVDGQPTNDNYVGSSYVGYDARVDLDDVERIEVVRGPGSVLYGTGAFFGVVNLVTRSRSVPTHVEAGISTADYGVSRARVHATYRFNEDAGFWTSISGAHDPGGRDFFFPAFVSTGANPSDGFARGVDGFDAGTISGRAWYKSLTLQWFYTDRSKHIPTATAETTFGDPSNVFRDTRSFLELRFEPKIDDKIHWLTRAHGNLYSFKGVLPYAPTDGGTEVDRFTGRWVGVEQRVEIELARSFHVTVGGEVQRHLTARQIGQNDAGYVLPERNDPYWVGAGYLLADWIPTSKIKVSPGARVDYTSTSGSSINPRLAIITRPWNTGVLKILGGKAFRAPSVYELFYAAATQTQAIGLKPEEIWSGELELSQKLSTLITATVSGYVNYVRHLVVLRGEGTEASPNFYENSERPVLTTGAEAEVRRDFKQGWMIGAQVSVQRTRYLQNGDGALREVPNSPGVLGSLHGAVPIVPRMLVLNSRVTVAGPRYDRYENAGDPPQGRSTAAFLWDLVLGGETERSGVHWSLGVYNLFDYRWTAPLSGEFRPRTLVQAGRTLYASLSVSF